MSYDWYHESRIITGEGVEVISAADSLGLYSYDEAKGPAPSVYGDPELALVEKRLLQEGPTDEDDRRRLQRDDRIEDILELCACLNPADRIILHCRHQGMIQEELGEMIGLTQVGVCNRITRIAVWMREALPIRAVLRATIMPSRWPLYGPHRRVWDALVWRHQTTGEVAQSEGCRQSVIYARWRRAVREVLAANGPEVAAAVSWVAGHSGRWHRPRLVHVRQFSDSPSIGAGTKIEMPDPDPEIEKIAYAIEFEMALYALEFGATPKTDHRTRRCGATPKTDHRTRRCGTGIDLSRGSVVTEVKRLFGRFGHPWAVSKNVDVEDAIADVFKDIEIRNQGTCPFDPNLGSFSTYIVRIIKQSMYRAVAKQERRIPSGLVVELGDVEHERIPDREGWTEHDYDEAQARVLGCIERHAGEDGLLYARVRLGLEPQDRIRDALPVAASTRVRRQLPAILAELKK